MMAPRGHARWSSSRWVALPLAGVLLAGACTGGGRPTRSSPEPSPNAIASGGVIPQPIVTGIAVAPESARVDVRLPTFSNPTEITNPLFPVSKQASVLFLGHVDGKPFRTEVTLLPYTRLVQWQGLTVRTAVSEYVAYLDGRIQEVAYDLYAQADDGSVWYFGEDVSDFVDGAIVTKEGTWLAGKDAPAAMIMPGHPQVGDVFRTENSPGFAFEEVTVKAVDRTLDGPVGPIPGGMVGEELHMDGKTEDKLFAPAYGEFFTRDGTDVEALALAVPTDAASGGVPADLAALETDANGLFDQAGTGDWKAASASFDRMSSSWTTYRAGGVPKLIEPVMSGFLRSLGSAVQAHRAARARHLAIEVARSSLDLELRYRPITEVNLARMDLWAAQILVDASANDPGSVRADVFALVYIRERILGALSAPDLTNVNTILQGLQVAATDENFNAASRGANRLRTTLGGLVPGV